MSQPPEKNGVAKTESPKRLPPTTAGRLLVALETTDSVRVSELAMRLAIPERKLIECRDHGGRLDSKLQVQLAELVLLLAPEHQRLAHRLRQQATAAVRYETEGDQVRHPSYPREFFR